MKKTDFIKERITCKELMNIDHGRNIACPFHEDKNPSFAFYDEGRKFKCFSCGENGSVIDLHAKLNNIPIESSIIELYKRCGGKEDYVCQFKKQIAKNAKCEDFLQTRKIDYEKVKNFIGYDNGYISSVLKNQEGEIIGTQKRNIEKKQFRITGEAGLFYNDKTKKGELYITEGLTDWLTIRQHTEAVMGFVSASSMPDCEKILKNYSRIYWLGDNDKAGEKLKLKFFEKYKEKDIYELKRGNQDINELGCDLNYIKENSELTMKGRKIFEDVMSVVDCIVQEMENTSEEDILSFGIDEVDDATGGIFPTTLAVIAAETGCGKSQFLVNLAYETAKSGKKVLYFDFENDFGNIIRRKAISKFNAISQFKIRYRDLKTNSILKGSHANKLANIMVEIQKELDGNLLIYDNKTIPTFEEFISYLDLAKDADLIVIDHLHYFAFTDEELMSIQLGKMMRAFRNLTKERCIPVVSASHLRKLPASKNYHPSNDDLFGSSNIAKESETVLMFSKISDGDYNTRIAVTKARNDGDIRAWKAKFDLHLKKYVGILKDFEESSYEFG